MSVTVFKDMLNSVVSWATKERQEAAQLGKMIPAYKVPTIALDTARTPHAQEPKTQAHGLFKIYGDYVAVESCDAVNQVYFYPQFKEGEWNTQPENRFDLRQYPTLPFGVHFHAFILEHSAETGKTLELSIGRESAFQPRGLTVTGLKNSQGMRIDPAKNPFRVYKYYKVYHGVMTVTGAATGTVEIDLPAIGFIIGLGFEASEWTEGDTLSLTHEKEDDTVLHIFSKLHPLNGADRWHNLPLPLAEPYLNTVAGQNLQGDWAGTNSTLKVRIVVEMMIATLVTS